MRLAIDMTAADRYPSSGISKVVDHLIRATAKDKPDWRVTAWHRDTVDSSERSLGGNVRHRVARSYGYWMFPGTDVWLDIALPLWATVRRADILYCPCNAVPARSPVPVVAALQDLIPLEIPDYAKRDDVKLWAKRMPARFERSSQVIVPSEFVRQRVIKWLPSIEDRVKVIPWASTIAFGEADRQRVPDVRRAMGLPDDARYLLALGSGQTHKNIGRLIEAWAGSRFLSEHTWLVVTGLFDEARERFTEMLQARGVNRGCILRGLVPQNDLPALLHGATALCYPSLTEGFGLPVLEAFQCQTPVAASNVASIPEVGGDAVAYFDPQSTSSIASTLEQLVKDDVLRNSLRDKGLERLKRYSWDEVARAHCEVFSSCV